MTFYFSSRLQALFWEIKNRFFYLLLSFFFTFAISYWYSKPLLYLFVLPFVNKYLKNDFLNNQMQNETFCSWHRQNQKKNSEDESILEIETINGDQENNTKGVALTLHNYFLSEKNEKRDFFSYVFSNLQVFTGDILYRFSNFFFKLKHFFLGSESGCLCRPEGENLRGAFNNNFENVFVNSEACSFGCDKINSLGATENVQFSSSFISLFSDVFSSENQATLESLLHFCKQFLGAASRSFIFTDVEEAFSCQILVCLIFSFVMIFPIIIYESFSFFSPSFYKAERRKWIWRVSITIASWYGFIYNVQNYCLPKLADFLLKFEISSLAFSLIAETKIKSYCIWALTIFLIGNFVFFSTVYVLFLIYEQKIKIEYFTVRRKTIRIFILLFSAFLVPPEIQFFLVLLGIFCFEVMVYFFFIYKQFRVFGLPQ